MGDVKPWLWGKNPCFVTLLVFHLPLSTSLMLQLVVGGVIAEVVVVVAGYQPYPLAHSTHVCPFFSLTHYSLVSFTLSPCDLVSWLLTHRLWAILVSRRHFLGLHELLKHPRTVICVLAVVLFIHGQSRSCFLLTQGLYCGASSRRGRVCFPCVFVVQCKIALTHRLVGVFYPCESRADCFVWGCCFSTFCWLWF